MFRPISGHTGLIIGISEAKNTREADFDVKTRVALQKPSKKGESCAQDPKFFKNVCFGFSAFFRAPRVVGG